MLVIIALLIGVLLVLMPDSMAGKFHDVFVYSLGSVLKIGPQSHISNIPQSLTPARTVPYEKYQELVEQTDRLESQLKTFQRKYLDLHKLYELATGTRQRLPDVGPGHIWAEVITFIPEKNEIDINRGQRDGLQPGQYVIGQDCLVGTVSQVNQYSAKVQLLTSSENELIVEIEAKDTHNNDIYRRAIMKGDGKNSCYVGGIQTAYMIEQGNYVYAYARPGYLNSPLVIGKVSSIKHDESDPLFWDIKVTPSFEVDKLKKVFAVTMQPQEGGHQ